jgi:hypothetical protein
MSRQSRKLSLVVLLTSTFVLLFACENSPSLSKLMNGRGTVIDNGGDKLTCTNDGNSQFNGDYTLDYVVTYDPTLGFADDPVLPDWTAHRARVEDFLKSKMPSALSSFQSYADNIGNSDDSGSRIWKASAFDLLDLKDEGLIQQLPGNCLRTNDDGTVVPNTTQMVRRREISTSSTRKIFYYYDYAKFEELKTDLPLQASYLIVHEWLWDFTNSPWVNRTINRLIHSKRAESMSKDDFTAHLKALGVEINGTGRPGPSGASESALESLFRSNPVCNFDDRVTVELQRFDRLSRIIIAPGASKEFLVKVPSDLLPASTWKACGFALMVTHQATGSSNSKVDLKITRGLATFDKSFAVSTEAPKQNFYDGLCLDAHCLNRSGELQDVITRSGFGNSEWRLNFKNTGSSEVELLAPYIVFSGMTPAP